MILVVAQAPRFGGAFEALTMGLSIWVCEDFEHQLFGNCMALCYTGIST